MSQKNPIAASGIAKRAARLRDPEAAMAGNADAATHDDAVSQGDRPAWDSVAIMRIHPVFGGEIGLCLGAVARRAPSA